MSSTIGTQEMTPAHASGDNIEASRVAGTSVYSTDGDKLGTVDDIVLGKRDGQVKYAILASGGFLGIGEDYYPLPWQVLKYDERQGGYVIGITIDQLQNGPKFAGEARPSWSDPAYGRGIDDYYGPFPAY